MVDLETTYSKIDKLISTFPECGHNDFVLRFIYCLRESASEAGEVHEQLADILQEALDTASKEEEEEEKEEDTESEATNEQTLFVTQQNNGVGSDNLELYQGEVIGNNRGIYCGTPPLGQPKLY